MGCCQLQQSRRNSKLYGCRFEAWWKSQKEGDACSNFKSDGEKEGPSDSIVDGSLLGGGSKC